MVTRFSEGVARRAALPLTERDERDLKALRGPTPQRAALDRLVSEDLPADISESGLLHALFALALAQVAAEAEAAGYAELAGQRDNEVRRQIARRRQPDWDDEP